MVMNYNVQASKQASLNDALFQKKNIEIQI